MKDSFYLAIRYIVFNKAKTITLVTCVSLIFFLPLALKKLLDESEQTLMSRAASTPLLVGEKGNALDLVMNALYFSDERPELITMQSAAAVFESSLALPVPLYVKFHAQNYPIVGTTVDYFGFRQRKLQIGRHFAMLGECVLGAEVAKKLKLKVGDYLLSSPENVFDLAGVYPLKMKIVGVLEASNSADDSAVFVDLKTAWVIQGLGHGHQDVQKIEDSQGVLDRSSQMVTASSKIKNYTEITEENLESFHFHGDPSIYPISAVIVIPNDEKSATILRGRYLSEYSDQQIVRPRQVIDDLLKNLFRIKDFIDAIVLVVTCAMLLVIILVINLSFRLRQKEINAIYHMGCSRFIVAQMLISEMVIILLSSGIVCYLLLWGLQFYQESIVQQLFITR